MNRELTDLLAVAEDLKRLLVLALLKQGVPQSEIAKALGLNQSSVSRLLSKKAK